MRHYIYLEEHRITYARAKGRFFVGSGASAVVLSEAKVWDTRGDTLDTFLNRFAEHHGLSGKSVTLVLGLDLFFLGMVLPMGRRSVVERMARNQLAVKAEFPTESAATVDYRHGNSKRNVFASLFYMEEKRLTEYKDAAAATGMACTHILAVPDCMALAAQQLWRELSHLVVDVEEEQLGLYLVSRGHCLCFTITALKVRRFCQMEKEALLYEEIAERAEHLFRLAAESDNENLAGFRPERVILLGDTLSSPEKGAARLEALLKLPCSASALHAKIDKEGPYSEASVLPSGLLAACMADRFPGKRKPVNMNGKGRGGKVSLFRGVQGILSKGWRLFLLVNIAAALCVGIWTNVEAHRTASELAELRDVLTEPGYRKEYQGLVDMEKELEQMMARDAVKEDVTGENLLGMDALRTFINSMETDMEVESMTYHGDHGMLSMVISMSSRGQIPLYVEEVKDTGNFPYVSHSLWEEKEEEGKPERFHVIVSASLTEGGLDETQ